MDECNLHVCMLAFVRVVCACASVYLFQVLDLKSQQHGIWDIGLLNL